MTQSSVLKTLLVTRGPVAWGESEQRKNLIEEPEQFLNDALPSAGSALHGEHRGIVAGPAS